MKQSEERGTGLENTSHIMAKDIQPVKQLCNMLLISPHDFVMPKGLYFTAVFFAFLLSSFFDA